MNIHSLLVWLLVISIIVVIIYVLSKTPLESFTINLNKKINIKTIFVCTTFDKYDYNFIMKWYKKLNFVVIYNGDRTEYLNKLPTEIEILNTENKGHDIGMWKYYITNNKDTIKKLNSIILMNNSMLYNKINMNEVVTIGSNYNIYGLYLTTVPDGEPPVMTSMMVMYNFDKLNVNDFIAYWDNLKIGGRDEALEHETNQLKYYYNLGYSKFGAYSSITLGPMDYTELKTKTDIKKYPLSIKKVCVINNNETESDKRYEEWLKM